MSRACHALGYENGGNETKFVELDVAAAIIAAVTLLVPGILDNPGLYMGAVRLMKEAYCPLT